MHIKDHVQYFSCNMAILLCSTCARFWSRSFIQCCKCPTWGFLPYRYSMKVHEANCFIFQWFQASGPPCGRLVFPATITKPTSCLKLHRAHNFSLFPQHHCRNCGEIFCNACSDNELPLPASPKPVRVCDTCHALLLQRCSSNTT